MAGEAVDPAETVKSGKAKDPTSVPYAADGSHYPAARLINTEGNHVQRWRTQDQREQAERQRLAELEEADRDEVTP